MTILARFPYVCLKSERLEGERHIIATGREYDWLFFSSRQALHTSEHALS